MPFKHPFITACRSRSAVCRCWRILDSYQKLKPTMQETHQVELMIQRHAGSSHWDGFYFYIFWVGSRTASQAFWLDDMHAGTIDRNLYAWFLISFLFFLTSSLFLDGCYSAIFFLWSFFCLFLSSSSCIAPLCCQRSLV